MKEITLVSNNKLIASAIIAAALILGLSAVIAANSVSGAQRAIADSQAKLAESNKTLAESNKSVITDLGNKINSGLDNIGTGTCLAGGGNRATCIMF